MAKDYIFDGGQGGVYRVWVVQEKAVEVTLPPDTTWGDYIDAVQAEAGGSEWKLRRHQLIEGLK